MNSREQYRAAYRYQRIEEERHSPVSAVWADPCCYEPEIGEISIEVMAAARTSLVAADRLFFKALDGGWRFTFDFLQKIEGV